MKVVHCVVNKFHLYSAEIGRVRKREIAFTIYVHFRVRGERERERERNMSRAYLAAAGAAATCSILAVLNLNLRSSNSEMSTPSSKSKKTTIIPSTTIKTINPTTKTSTKVKVITKLLTVKSQSTMEERVRVLTKWVAVAASVSFVTALTYVAYKRYRRRYFTDDSLKETQNAKHSESRTYKIHSTNPKWIVSEETVTLRDGTSCDLLREVHTSNQTKESKRSSEQNIQLSSASGFGLSRYQWRMSTNSSPDSTPSKITSQHKNSVLTPTRATPMRVRLHSSSSTTTTTTTPSTSSRFNRNTRTPVHNNNGLKRRVTIDPLTPLHPVVDSK